MSPMLVCSVDSLASPEVLADVRARAREGWAIKVWARGSTPDAAAREARRAGLDIDARHCYVKAEGPYTSARVRAALGLFPDLQYDTIPADAIPGVKFIKAAPGIADRGVMVALPLPDAVARKLAVEGGEPAANLHITLAYLGKLGEDLDGKPDEILTAIGEALAPLLQNPPLTGEIAGIDSFEDHGSGVPHYTTPDIKGLKPFRAALVVELEGHDLKLAGEGAGGPYIPHVTLRYGGAQPHPVAPTAVILDRILVKVGTEERSYTLRAPAAPKSYGLATRRVKPASQTKRDVSDEERDDHGRWTDDGGNASEKPGDVAVGEVHSQVDDNGNHVRYVRAVEQRGDQVLVSVEHGTGILPAGTQYEVPAQNLVRGDPEESHVKRRRVIPASGGKRDVSDEERDDRGRWTDGGGSASEQPADWAETSDNPAESRVTDTTIEKLRQDILADSFANTGGGGATYNLTTGEGRAEKHVKGGVTRWSVSEPRSCARCGRPVKGRARLCGPCSLAVVQESG